MNKKYEPLFTPWKIGKCKIKNRIVMCPMGGTSLFGWMEKHHFDKDAANLFMDIAKHDVGLIIPGIAPIRNIMGGQWLYKAKGAFKELEEYMKEFHKTGAKMFIQLTAGFGRSFTIPEGFASMARNKFVATLIKPIIDFSRLTASPSKLPSRWCPGYTTREITKKEIEEMVDAFAKTAKMLQDAGVDGVEIHAVHEGYLLDQFTHEYTNHRTDEYGGSFENRYRFATDIVKAIKQVCGKDFPVSLRYSVVSKTKGFNEGALPGEKFKEVGRDMKESEKAIKYLEDAGYDMFDADNGTYDAWYWAHPPSYMPINCNLKDVEHIKEFTKMPVVCAGRMEPDAAANAIKNGKIDAMGVARQFLADPHWVTKLKEERPEDILPCICCHNGCFPMAHYKGVSCDVSMADSKGMARCALNPLVMQKGKYEIIKTTSPKRIAVVGGGVGGMEVARIATLRGHKVVIYEKTDHLGGVFVPAASFPFKEKDRMLIKWYEKQIKDLNIEVRFNTEVKNIRSLDADEIVIATGAKARTLGTRGFEKTMEALDYLNGKPVGDDVVIIGGGLTGCEIAYDLFLKGKRPVIVEMQNDLMAVPGLCLANSSYLRDFFKLKEVPVYLESAVTEVKDGSVIIRDKNGNKREVKADNVISCVGYIPAPIAEEDKNVHIIGDTLKVGNLRTVVWGAWEVAEKL